MTRSWRLLTAAALASGIVCQFLQQTDPVTPLAYFTVWSACLGVVSMLVGATLPSRLTGSLAGPAAAGCVMSGIVFATVIAPATPTGSWFQPWDDTWVRAANVLLHGVGPLMIAIDYIAAGPLPSRSWRAACTWCVWPLLYLVVVTSTRGRTPYPFLDVDEVGIAGAILAVCGLALVFALLGRLLIEVGRRARRDATPPP